MKHIQLFQLVFSSFLLYAFVNNSFAQTGFTISGTTTLTNSPNSITVDGTTTTGIYIGKRGVSNTTAIGENALSATTTGTDNTAIGKNALTAITTSSLNTAVGSNALSTSSGNSTSNTAVGANALKSTGAGSSYNTAVGAEALKNATAGAGNTAIGYNSLFNLGTGTGNTAVGFNAIYTATGSSTGNTALGYNTLKFVTGNSNTAVGYEAALGVNGSSSAAGNVAFGQQALEKITSGTYNSGFGYLSLNSITTGTNNIGIGYKSLYGLNSGSFNVAIGNEALSSITSSGSNIAIGNNSLKLLSSGINNVGIGANTSLSNGSDQLTIQNVIYGTNMSSAANGYIGIGGIPTGTAKLEVNGTLRVNTVNTTTSQNTARRFLWRDVSDNNLIKEEVVSIGNTNSCGNVNYVPVTSSTSGDMSCSNIFNNSTSIGIFQNSGFGYTSGGTLVNGSPTPPSDFTLSVNGWTSSTAFVALSDRRMKTNLSKIENPLNKISKINGYTYDWDNSMNTKRKTDGNRQSGLIAQELLEVLPEAVIKSEDGIYGINYDAVMPLLTEAIKAQQDEISSLKSELKELREEIYKNKPGVIQKEEKKYFSISPNPVTNQSVISYNLTNQNAYSKFVIYDLQGKLIKQILISGNQLKGQIILFKSDFQNGMYVISLLKNNAEIQSEKILIAN